MRIVFHGDNAASFSHGFAERLGAPAEIAVLPDDLAEADRAAYAAAEVIVGAATAPTCRARRAAAVPCARRRLRRGRTGRAAARRRRLQLLRPRAGHRRIRHGGAADAPDPARRGRPRSAPGPLDILGGRCRPRARRNRRQDHRPARVSVISARRSRPAPRPSRWGCIVANRSPVATSALVDRAYLARRLADFFGAADAYVVSLPLTPETTGIVGREAFAAMRPTRSSSMSGAGRPIDEAGALQRPGAAAGSAAPIIDTWYRIPAGSAGRPPSAAALRAAAECRDDPAHVGLDERHDPPAPEGDRRERPSQDGRAEIS